MATNDNARFTMEVLSALQADSFLRRISAGIRVDADDGVVTLTGSMESPEDRQAAIDAALGAAMQHIVVESEYDAKLCIEYLRAHSLGRATFLPLQALNVRRLSAQERALLRMPQAYGGVVQEDVEAGLEHALVQLEWRWLGNGCQHVHAALTQL